MSREPLASDALSSGMTNGAVTRTGWPVAEQDRRGAATGTERGTSQQSPTSWSRTPPQAIRSATHSESGVNRSRRPRRVSAVDQPADEPRPDQLAQVGRQAANAAWTLAKVSASRKTGTAPPMASQRPWRPGRRRRRQRPVGGHRPPLDRARKVDAAGHGPRERARRRSWPAGSRLRRRSRSGCKAGRGRPGPRGQARRTRRRPGGRAWELGDSGRPFDQAADSSCRRMHSGGGGLAAHVRQRIRGVAVEDRRRLDLVARREPSRRSSQLEPRWPRRPGGSRARRAAAPLAAAGAGPPRARRPRFRRGPTSPPCPGWPRARSAGSAAARPRRPRPLARGARLGGLRAPDRRRGRRAGFLVGHVERQIARADERCADPAVAAELDLDVVPAPALVRPAAMRLRACASKISAVPKSSRLPGKKMLARPGALCSDHSVVGSICSTMREKPSCSPPRIGPPSAASAGAAAASAAPPRRPANHAARLCLDARSAPSSSL